MKKVKNYLNEVKVKSLDKKLEKLRIEAIMKQRVMSFELPNEFMQIKKCTFHKEVESCKYYKNIFNETKIVVPSEKGYVICNPDGSVNVEIPDRKSIVVKQNLEGKNLPYYRTKIYKVEV